MRSIDSNSSARARIIERARATICRRAILPLIEMRSRRLYGGSREVFAEESRRRDENCEAVYALTARLARIICN